MTSSTGSRIGRGLVIGAVAMAAGVVVGSVGYASVTTPKGDSSGASESSDVAKMAGDLSDAERQEILERLPDDERSGMKDMLDNLSNGRIRVSNLVEGTEVSGWVSTDMMSAAIPRSFADLWPVYSDAGAVVGYIAPGIR